jgi:hypothetical protein
MGKQSQYLASTNIFKCFFSYRYDRPGLPDFSWYNIPKREKYTKLPKIPIPNGDNIDQMAVKCTNVFKCKTLQNLPKLGFSNWKYTIWQPWSSSFWSKLFVNIKFGKHFGRVTFRESWFLMRQKNFSDPEGVCLFDVWAGGQAGGARVG